jgi:hypothetical protein
MKKYIITLTKEERDALRACLNILFHGLEGLIRPSRLTIKWIIAA